LDKSEIYTSRPSANGIRLGDASPLWCAVTGATLWTMESPEALLMPMAGLSTLILAAYRSLSGFAAARWGIRVLSPPPDPDGPLAGRQRVKVPVA